LLEGEREGIQAELYSKIITFFAIMSLSVASGLTIQGTVYDSQSKEPLPGVTIQIIDTHSGASSDTKGNFDFDFDGAGQSDLKLAVHLIGYQDTTIALEGDAAFKKLSIYLKPSLWKMEQTVVTATRRKYILKDVPITTELITSKEFSETGALTVDEALSSHIGVDISDDLSGKGISLRGVDPSRVLILLDGERVIGRVRGSLDIGQLPLSNVDRIEIVKGTGSTLYGSDAIGGVVNVITKKPKAIGSANFYSSYGSFNSYNLQTGFDSGMIGKGSLFTAKYEHTDGFDLDKSTEHTNGLENTSRFNINNRTTFSLADGLNLDVTTDFMAEKKQWVESEIIQNNVGSDTAYNYDDFEHNYRYDLALKTRWNIDEKADFSFGLSGSYYDHIWKKFTRTNAWIDTSKTIDDIYSASFQYNRMFTQGHVLTFGGDITTQGLKSEQLASGNERIFYEDLYTQYEWRPVKRISILPGVRWEHHETYGDHINPGLNAMWDACDYFNLRASVNRGYRAPSLKELYFEFDHSAAGYKVIGGGEELDPETSMNYSVTAEINYDRKAIHRLTYFRNDLRNLIDLNLIESPDPVYYLGIYDYANIVKAKTEGFEWETEIKALENLDLSFSYTYLSAKNLTDTTDTPLINRPCNTFKFNTGYTIARFDTRINFWGFWNDHKLWTSKKDTPDKVSDEYAPSRWSLNAGLAREIYKGVDLFFKVENLTNDTNARYNYWPARNYTLSLTYNIK